MHRHKGITWSQVQAKVLANPQKLWSLNQMEGTGGEPDVIAYDKKSNELISLIVQPKLPKTVEMFATIERHWMQEKSISQKTVLWIWLTKWA